MIPAFGFSAELGATSLQCPASAYDEKVKNTIIYVLSDYFNRNENACLSYICDTKGGYARHRNIVFRRWLRETGYGHIERVDCRKEYNRAGLYASILIRRENPLKKYYVDAFHRSITVAFSELIDPQKRPA